MEMTAASNAYVKAESQEVTAASTKTHQNKEIPSSSGGVSLRCDVQTGEVKRVCTNDDD